MSSSLLTRQQTNVERSGFRDAWLSDWHRHTHPSLAMSDVDWICVEMRYAHPVALVDYKLMAPRTLEPTSALRGVNNLAIMAGLPFFVVFYQHDPAIFTVSPMNRLARFIEPELVTMSEREYIAFLFAIRGEKAPIEALRDRSDRKS
jgi:hypothetical protein